MLYSEVKAIILYWRKQIGDGKPQRRIIHKLIREMHKNDQLHQKNTELTIESFRRATEMRERIVILEATTKRITQKLIDAGVVPEQPAT